MAIVYPLVLPDVKLICRYFDFEIPGQEGATKGGSPIGTEDGSGVFRADYETPPLRGYDIRLMTAWMDEAKKVKASVWARDTRARYPRAYQKVGWTGLVRAVDGSAFDGTCTLASVGGDGYTLGLSRLPAGFKLGPADALSYLWETSRTAYHRIGPMDVAIADGTGALTISFNPRVMVGVTTGAVVHLDKPAFRGHFLRKSERRSRTDVGQMTFGFSIQQSHDQVD